MELSDVRQMQGSAIGKQTLAKTLGSAEISAKE